MKLTLLAVKGYSSPRLPSYIETEVTGFIKHELGWKKTRIPQDSAGNGNHLSVITERLDEKGPVLEDVNRITLVISISFIVFGLISVFLAYLEELGTSLIITGILLQILTSIGLIYSKKLHKENAWLEYKDLNGKATLEEINKSINQYNYYKINNHRAYRFVEHYFVSVNGFTENALEFAHGNGIICYEKRDGKFRRIGYSTEQRLIA